MIDRNLLRNDSERVIALITKKDPKFPIHDLISLDRSVLDLQQKVELVRSQKNELARQGRQGVTQELRQKASALGQELKQVEQELQEKMAAFEDLYLRCPNILADDVPVGDKDQNVVVKTWGEKPVFAFTPKNHVELGEQLGWLDFDAAARISGSHFALYKGEGVKLLYALSMFMLNNNIEHGYTPILPPYLVSEKALIGSSNLPRFKDQVYELDGDDLFLTPTAEVNLTNLYRDQIFERDDLPVRMTAWTSCFRREAGGYGATERGLIRIHQFEKVELYAICAQENAAQEHERMIYCAETILQKLGLHYQISLLAAQDCSFPSAKTYDIEVWMPGQKEYKEVSSVSICTDFQSRRCAMRYRPEPGKKPCLAYTLNGSSLALPRLMVALLETYQQEDGSIVLPDILKSVCIGV